MTDHTTILIVIIIKEFIGGIRLYEEARDEVMRMHPELANYFHDEIRLAILERIDRPAPDKLLEMLASAYKSSIADQNELGD